MRRPTAPRLAAGAIAAAASACTFAAPVDVRVADPRGRPLADAVVFLDSDAARAAVRPAEGVEVSQAEKRFVPMLTVVPVGTAVAFPNRDTVRHHVYSFSPAKPFELKLYIGRPANPVVFDRPGVVVLGCNIHDEMVAWIVAVETPWVARTPADGHARLDAPAGRYRLRVWHPGLPAGAPPHEQAFEVGAAGGSAAVALAPAFEAPTK